MSPRQLAGLKVCPCALPQKGRKFLFPLLPRFVLHRLPLCPSQLVHLLLRLFRLPPSITNRRRSPIDQEKFELPVLSRCYQKER